MSTFLIEAIAAFLGTIAFSLLFQIRPRHFFACGLLGGLGWLIYRTITLLSSSPMLGIFLAALVLTLCSRWLATLKHAPALIFLVCAIFPLVPGAAIYYSSYYLFLADGTMALYYAILTLKTGIAIALGVFIAYSFPAIMFGWHRQ